MYSLTLAQAGPRRAPRSGASVTSARRCSTTSPSSPSPSSCSASIGGSARTRRGEDPIDRLSDLPSRVVEAGKLVATNEKQFDRDLTAGLMHTFILWGFLTLLIGTTILMIDMDIWTLFAGQPSFFVGDFYLAYSFVLDAMGFLFVVGVGMALYKRYWRRNDRLWGKHTSAEDGLFVWTLFLLGVGGYVTEGSASSGRARPATSPSRR